MKRSPLSHRSSAQRRGLTLLELVIALGLLSVMTVAITFNVDRQARSLGASTMRANVDLNADILLDRISERLEFARRAPTRTTMTVGLGGGGGSVRVTEIAGFPPTGFLRFEPGTGIEEAVEYEGQDVALSEFETLTRAGQCTVASGYFAGTDVLWEGVAEVLSDQVAPDPDDFNGLSAELRGNTFFLGVGTGISFQVPVRAGVGGSMFDADGEMVWGASVGGVDVATGYEAFEWVAVRAVLEANLAADLNGDGDQADVFDVGHVQLRSWDATAPVATQQVSVLCPPMILQERCNYGGDLDGDGFQDPIFLIDPETGRLRVRVFSLLETREGSSARRDETTILLDNSAQG